MKWVRAFKNATGARRYVIGGVITIAISLFDMLRPYFPGLGMVQLVGIPSWAVGIMVALGFLAFWFLKRVVDLETQVNGARTALAVHRATGVALRNEGKQGFLNPAEFKEWEAKIAAWNSEANWGHQKI